MNNTVTIPVPPELIATPALDRMVAVRDRSQVCGEFLEWLQGRYTLCRLPTPIRLRKNRYYRPARINIEELLADFFGVDLDEIEKERRMLLEVLRARQE